MLNHPAQNRILRGEILRVLYRNLPYPVGDNLLATIFTQETLTQIQGNLRYLADKRYVELVEVKEPYSSATLMAKLNSLGVDLLEGTLPADPGVIVPAI